MLQFWVMMVQKKPIENALFTLLLNIHKNGRRFKAYKLLIKKYVVRKFGFFLNNTHREFIFPRAQLSLAYTVSSVHFLVSQLVATAGTVSTRQKRRSETITLYVLTAMLAWLRCSYPLFSPPPFSYFSSVETPLHLCWMLMLFMAQRPVFSLKPRSVLWRQVFLRECYKKWTHPPLSDGVVMICSTDSLSLLQKLQLNVSAFSLELLPHAPSRCLRGFSPVWTLFSLLQCSPVLLLKDTATQRMQYLGGYWRQLHTGSGRSLVAARWHSDGATASASPQTLQQLWHLYPQCYHRGQGRGRKKAAPAAWENN